MGFKLVAAVHDFSNLSSPEIASMQGPPFTLQHEASCTWMPNYLFVLSRLGTYSSNAHCLLKQTKSPLISVMWLFPLPSLPTAAGVSLVTRPPTADHLPLPGEP